MYLVQDLDKISFQDVVQIYLLSLNYHDPIFHPNVTTIQSGIGIVGSGAGNRPTSDATYIPP
jgi:hypothetical protein